VKICTHHEFALTALAHGRAAILLVHSRGRIVGVAL
jgi:hypothetical protein